MSTNIQGNHCLKQKNKNLLGLIKDELVGTIMKGFVGIRAKTYNYLKDNNNDDKKLKTCVMKRKIKSQDCKNCLKHTQIENKMKHLKK